MATIKNLCQRRVEFPAFPIEEEGSPGIARLAWGWIDRDRRGQLRYPLVDPAER
jgi:hypothetical protein